MTIETPAQQFVPPYPQPLVNGYTGYAGGDPNDWTTDTGSAKQVPTPYDLEWVAGDTAVFTFFVPNVNWTPTDPGGTPTVAWEYVTWRSQVRGSHYYYYGYWWPPTFPLGPYLMEFTCTAAYIENDATLGTGTQVTIKGGMAWVGDFKWDLQAEHHVNVNDPTYYEAHTLYQGNAKVLPQYTSPTLYAPSNWPMYSLAANVTWPPPPAQGPIFP
jgi:hypothetical protein